MQLMRSNQGMDRDIVDAANNKAVSREGRLFRFGLGVQNAEPGSQDGLLAVYSFLADGDELEHGPSMPRPAPVTSAQTQ